MAEHKPRGLGNATLVGSFLVQHPNVEVTADEISKATGLDAKQVQNAIYTIHKSSQFNMKVEKVVPGHSWRFISSGSNSKTAAKPTDEVFEVLGSLKDGSLLLRDSEGRMYKAEEM